jgi:hypothetical protein
MVAVVDRWSLFGGGRWLRFDCIYILHTVCFSNFLQIETVQKAAHKIMLKLTIGVNFINILHAHFSYKILAPKVTKLKHS